MKIEPRYEGPLVFAVDGPDVREPFLRQQQRFVAMFAALDDAQWRQPTRCDAWTVQDIAIHLGTVNRFWHGSISAGLAGQPSQLLVGFDPAATPDLLVEAGRSAPPTETLAELADSSQALRDLVSSLDDDQMTTLAEAPAGLIPIGCLINHGLWDCWTHERDVALPLGLPVTEEPDEVLACLRFVSGLGAVFALTSGSAHPPATLVVEATDPGATVVVEVTDHVAVHDGAAGVPADPTVVLRGRAVDLVEALSCRAPFTDDIPAEHQWLFSYLSVIFETS